MSKNLRRNTLKAMAFTMPAIWTKPVVDVVVLPSHAQMSLISSCGPITASDEDIDGVDLDRVFLFFDGDDCSMELRDNLTGIDTDTTPDLVMVLDVDTMGTRYEIQRAGSNDWSVSVGTELGLTNPELDFIATRQTGPIMGSQFRFEIEIDLDPPEMTVRVRVFAA